MVPNIRGWDQWATTMFDQHVVLKTEAEVADIERKILNRGYYPVRMSGDDSDQIHADPEEVTDGSPGHSAGDPAVDRDGRRQAAWQDAPSNRLSSQRRQVRAGTRCCTSCATSWRPMIRTRST